MTAFAQSPPPTLDQIGQLPARLLECERKLESMELFMREFLNSLDDQIGYKEALKISGIKSRTTLVAERRREGSLIKFTHHGRSVAYSRAGCVAYRLAHLGN